MKHLIFVGAMALGAALNAADSITTRNGITYTNAVIQRADPDGLVIEYAPQPGSVGIAKLKFANLPDEVRKRYDYKPTDATTFEQNQAAGIARRQEEIAQGEIEKKRRQDEFVQRRAEEEALEFKRQEMAWSQMETGNWYGGYGGYYSEGDWYGIGHRRFRYNSRGPLRPHGPDKVNPLGQSADSSGGVPLTGAGTGWGDSGHWGPLPGEASGRPGSQSGVSRGPVVSPRGGSFPARPR